MTKAASALDELLAEMTRRTGPKDKVKNALTGFYTVLAAHPGQARVFLVDLDDHAPAMRAVSQEASRKLAALFAPGVTHPLEIAGILGAIVQIAKRWIDSEFAEPVERVVGVAMGLTKNGAVANSKSW